jgi:hypothetical protein
MRKTIQTKLDRFGLTDRNMRQKEQQQGIKSALNRIKKAEQQVQQEEEPYWTAGEWELWAANLYKDIPEARKYLPKWFLEAYEQ